MNKQVQDEREPGGTFAENKRERRRRERAECISFELSRLVERKTLKEVEVLHHLFERSIHEQSFFWSRFTAMLTLHAAGFALANAIAFTNKWAFVCGAVVLGFLWVVIQWRSLEYVDTAKERFNIFARRLGLSGLPDHPFATEPLPSDAAHPSDSPKEPFRDRVIRFLCSHLNSTRAGMWTALLVLLYWVIWLVVLLSR